MVKVAAVENAFVWFRNDLRVTHNPALLAASQYSATHGGRVYALLVTSPLEWRSIHNWGLPKASYYVRTVSVLRRELSKRGIEMLLHTPTAKNATEYYKALASEIVQLCKSQNCSAVYMNAEYDGVALERDAAVASALDTAGILHHTTHDQCVVPVGKVLTQSGTPYKVFSQFKKTWIRYIEEHGLDMIDSEPTEIEKSSTILPDIELDLGYDMHEYPNWDLNALHTTFPAGETEARKRLHEFLQKSVSGYHEDRNHFMEGGASKLSAPLAVGAISLTECLLAARIANKGALNSGSPGLLTWMSELCWRDFYRHVLFHFPHVGRGASFRPEFEHLSWRGWPPNIEPAAEEHFQAWCEGRTGYPIVDAAMRQLRREGWLCNRLRMVVAMFLTKDLRIHWRRGEQHFNQFLVDYDFSSNNGGWQWSASTGTDAQPYFRIFNPLLQSEKFDPSGDYIRRYVDELSKVSAPSIHDPFKRCKGFDQLKYPRPIVDHSKVKEQVLALFTAATTVTTKRPAD
ncbi:DNA photolyase domain-containing protein [Paramicrosporidium saccamoebae]|uniref:DNA photolyase domain-containing protein n=1 Tax=Paramicrosporidium saccamoebae TaxID=1246581 RepID=A0A2H9TP37_9FUNG|nr:DNA photolyase domain-containing protein [Paramicrosporidium saccamoebae]